MTEEEVMLEDGGMYERPLTREEVRQIEQMEAEKNENTLKKAKTKLSFESRTAETYKIEPAKSKKEVISGIKKEESEGMLKFAREQLLANESKEKISGKKSKKSKKKLKQKKLEIKVPAELAKELPAEQPAFETAKEPAKELEITAEPAKENAITKEFTKENTKQELIKNDNAIKTLADDLPSEISEKFKVPLIEPEIQIKEHPDATVDKILEKKIYLDAKVDELLEKKEADDSQFSVCSKEIEKEQRPQTIDRELLIGPQKSYKLLEKIGEGGFGTVYKIEEITTGVQKAVKIFHKEKAGKISVQKLENRVKEVNKRCDEEVVKVDHVCKDEKGLYIIMPLMKESADKFIEKKAVKEKIDLFYKILADVKKLHEHGIIHKDLKPSNVLIDKYGNPKLSDTDLVQIIEHETGVERSDCLATTTGNDAVRSFYYTAPEQLSSKQVDSRADIYSLGIILYEFITGEKFSTDWTAEMESQNYSPELIKIISKAIRKNPEQRYQTVEELRKDIEKLDLEKIMRQKKEITDAQKQLLRNVTVEIIKDGQKLVKTNLFDLATMPEEISLTEGITRALERPDQPKVEDGEKEKNVQKYFSRCIKNKWNKVDYWNTITQLTSMADGINNILKNHGDCLKSKGFEAKIMHKEFNHEKKITDFRSLEEAILRGYQLTSMENGGRDVGGGRDVEAGFESEKLELHIINVPSGLYAGFWASAKIKAPFEGNQKLYSELKDYFDSKLKSWWRNTKHFKELKEQGYTYETARQLFLNGTFEQFRIGRIRVDTENKSSYAENKTIHKIKIEELEKQVKQKIIEEKDRTMENAVQIEHDEEVITYKGKWDSVEYGESNRINGNASIEKLQKGRTIWRINTPYKKFIVYDGKLANSSTCGADYAGGLVDEARKKGIELTPKLLDLVFSPLDKRILQIYKEQRS